METQIGKVVHFFDKISVAILALTGDLKVGDQVRFLNEKHGLDFSQAVESIQVEHKELATGSVGMEVGVKVSQPSREGTLVYKVS